jgi:hypothetical protein
MEVLRNIQASGYNIELAYQKTVQWADWRSTYFPIKITPTIENLIVIDKIINHFRILDFYTSMGEIGTLDHL